MNFQLNKAHSFCPSPQQQKCIYLARAAFSPSVIAFGVWIRACWVDGDQGAPDDALRPLSQRCATRQAVPLSPRGTEATVTVRWHQVGSATQPRTLLHPPGALGLALLLLRDPEAEESCWL